MLNKLQGLHIAVPESRQLGVLKNLFERRGAQVFACPLVSIHDSPNTQDIEKWLNDFIASPPDYFIILTGEGIYRLTGFAERAGIQLQWAEALAKTHKLVRGPKPNRALKVLHLQAEQLAEQPTTDGVIQSLEKIRFSSSDNISVQLYGDNPNEKLQAYLQSRQLDYNTVAPYIYASDAETEQVLELIHLMANKTLDMICFTSQPQYKRLLSVAKKHELEQVLEQGLNNIKIAAVGPVVAQQLKDEGYEIDFIPDGQFFMKPMVSAMSQT